MSTHEDLRPPGILLVLLLRAAVADPADGPWITAYRSAGNNGLISHHITVTRDLPATPTRLTLLSGLDVLGYAHHHRWTPAEVTEPTNRQISALRTFAMLHNDVSGWARDFTSWSTWRTSPEWAQERQQHDDNAAAAARSLRWILAEQWLSRQ